jgi:hypothetical protein
MLSTQAAPITEDWLRSVGFKWHELNREPVKHWLLWIGECLAPPKQMFSGPDDFGIELAPSPGDRQTWNCWFRSDLAGLYTRFIHVRELQTQDQLTRMIEGLTLMPWKPEDCLYGAMRRPEVAARIREDEKRLDRQLLFSRPVHDPVEEDTSRSGALPEHLSAFPSAN